MLLWKSMIGIFGRDQPQIVCTELLGQLLACGCSTPALGASPAVSRAESSAAALSSAICLRVLYQVTDPVLCSSKAQFKLYTSQGKKTKTKAHTCTKSTPPIQNSFEALEQFHVKGRERRNTCRTIVIPRSSETLSFTQTGRTSTNLSSSSQQSSCSKI